MIKKPCGAQIKREKQTRNSKSVNIVKVCEEFPVSSVWAFSLYIPQSWKRKKIHVFSLPSTLTSRLSVPCGGVVIEIMVCLSGSDNRYPGATGTWCLINWWDRGVGFLIPPSQNQGVGEIAAKCLGVCFQARRAEMYVGECASLGIYLFCWQFGSWFPC